MKDIYINGECYLVYENNSGELFVIKASDVSTLEKKLQDKIYTIYNRENT